MTSNPDNNGKIWTKEEDTQLIKLYTENKNIIDIASIYKRTTGSINSRLIKLGLIKEYDDIKGNNHTIMFLDTETTGLPERNASPNEVDKFNNARLIELGYIINKVETVNLVKPDNFNITNTFIHGISNDMAMNEGKMIKEVLEQLYNDLMKVDTIICHNISFDMNIILSECYRINYNELILLIESKNKLCTMAIGKKILKLDKSPKLVELYKMLYNKEVKQEHRSISDCKICSDCYDKLHILI